MTQIKAVKIDEKLQTIILPLRNPKELANSASVAIGFCLMVGHAVLEKYARLKAAATCSHLIAMWKHFARLR